MFGSSLKYYRLKKALSKADLAKMIGVSSMAITNYENGNRTPNMETIKALANVLDVKVADFLLVNNGSVVFNHGEFQKNSSLSKMQQEYVRTCVEEYFSRFMTIIEILGKHVLPVSPPCHVLPLSSDDEANAASLRRHLGFACDGPIDDLIGKLENKGILVYVCDINEPKFSGMNGFVNDIPYIVINKRMTTERNRSTIAHELSHLMFIWPPEMGDAEIEKRATAISGAFLFPKVDAIRELGIKRTAVTKDMELVAAEYGISMLLLATRAKICRILSPSAAKTFYINASKRGWRSQEPSRIEEEAPALFEQLVYRAVNEEEIGLQRGAELLHQSYTQVQNHCCFSGV